MAWQPFFQPTVIVPFALLSLYLIWIKITDKYGYFNGLPWIGRRSELFSETRANWSSIKQARMLMEDGYYKYSKKAQAFVLPGWASGPEVILPPAQIRWLVDQPDAVLSAREVHHEILEADYVFQYAHAVHNPIHEDVIRRDLNRQLASLTTEIVEELTSVFDQHWGSNTEEWKEIPVFKNMMATIVRTTNRVLVGRALCENEEFVANAAKYVRDVVMSGAIIRMLPAFLKPVVGRLLTLPNGYHYRKCAKHLVPLVKQRIADMERKRTEPEFKWEEPNDYVTWSIRDSRSRPDPLDRNVEMLAYRIMLVNFSAIHSSTFTVTNLLFDLLGSPPEKGFMAGLRDEVEQILETADSVWDKTGVGRMIRVDSAIRESMRLSSFIGRGLERKVMSNAGLTLEDGTRLPQGVNVGVSVYSIHHDEAFYERAYEYDAFRFSRLQERSAAPKDILADVTAAAPNGKPDIAAVQHKNISMVTTSDTFLSFGHGRHTCPGRLFAANEIKLLLAYIVLNYDIKPLAVRPPNRWIGDTVLPPMEATIQVRRRK